ncbi:MAG: flagellar biosynthesis protein FlhF [Curvibacter sp. RIFCSPHIGHO2_12_FULL_63_18]|uniref:flagellar biosynthesis protein FlhF n=1 Tax=Rhodoferax sp. TaxID=50421 RepID=UPI0008CA9C39|nr:flagellar biosynthesis protein FlhF [Rhodoferax sp.]OGO98877.1 MAG: flagellar biosynthesis protein FlhF [Curvibacter sp. GWA2_63_95]OGP06239.1 MAG: flagellar biosynthesis protein FlhF [Curvibacter sp. RIFCSPHIGHO2_12_FULL_63_18]HCX83144.1 flagellar biosynthesis protein FlhF [Rhodoferax sp.]
MNIQRFTAATSREALAKARLAFGEGTLILSNRPTEHGVEVVATAEDTLASLDRGAASAANKLQAAPRRPSPPASYQEVASKVEEDAEQLAMSTLSFQDYVRERMLRRRHEAAQGAPEALPAPAPAAPERPRPPALTQRIAVDIAPPAPKPAAARKPQTLPATAAVSKGVMDELHAMKELIEDRFNTLTWLGQARQNPIQSNMMLKMIRAGYSPTLSRAILERMPEEMDAAESVRWVMDVLERNLHTDAGTPALHEEGGVFALIGATGVGKTTTAAKLAGLCARTHGPGSVGLITLDTYRIGAHEQLRAYGKMLGVVAHLAHDKAALQDLLGLLSNKKMVLIDTTGIAPRDPRKRELMELLDLPAIKRLLVLNAGGHGDTLDEAVNCFKTNTSQQAIFSKIDEAVKLGPAIDAAIRHQLLLRGITTGQRVPEDWESAVASKLVRMSMRTAGISAYDPKVSDLGFFFSQPTSTQGAAKGRMDA